ncbi:MAG TPA: FtsK/SpoIIIE domain-containing protein [Phycisphaerae bacterium]|nr:FtsK/SpoIIIE domain-containing protein [Phycisphaerae bacterium]
MSAIAPSTPPHPPTPPTAPEGLLAPGVRDGHPSPKRDVQRHSLDQVVRLSIECAAEEQRVETQHREALEQETAAHRKRVKENEERHHRRLAELTSGAEAREQAILERYATQQEEIENESQATQQRIARERETLEVGLKRKLKQATWQAESGLVSVQMQLDTEERQTEKELEERMGELKALEDAARTAVAPYPLEHSPVGGPMDEALKQRLDKEPRAVLGEERTKCEGVLKELQGLSHTRVMAGILPVVVIVVLGAIGAGIGWVAAADFQSKMIAAGSAGVGTMIAAAVVFMVLRSQEWKRVAARAGELYEQITLSLVVARHAVKAEGIRAADLREQQVDEARVKSEKELAAAREKARAVQREGTEQHAAAAATETKRHQDRLAANEEEKTRGQADLQRFREETQQQIEREEAEARDETERHHAATLAAMESAYQRDSQALEARWGEGLRAVRELLAAGSGIDPRLVDWNSPAWEEWKAPRESNGQVRFGEMKVDLAQLAAQIPVRLKLPETFIVPAMLTLPDRGSLLVETDHAGRAAAIDVAQMVMARLLTQMPAGRVKFTIFDPVGLGQSFAGFMHLADHDESLVGSRIWTETEHIEQRLADLTEHMETVIQKYLRNEYATIDEYNAQAGELAEPIRYLVIADFPTGFEAEALRRLSSIATTGPKCGVYTIILRDTRQPLPQGSRMEEIVSRSVHLAYKNGAFTWEDAVFKRFPLKMDAPPDEKTLTGLMDKVGKAAKEAKRVEVPFQSIAPAEDQFWSMSSKNELRVPIGKSGATRLQAMRLGVGVAQHTLVAGKTGSGKSNLMHTIVTNLAMWYGPDEIEFYLVDFKKGVEFKAYASSELPHARAIAVESDREFGLSVLHRVDAELTRRGAMFRDAGVQEITAYRDRTGQKLPRTVLLIDEFQEFFSEDDKLAQEASVLLDRLVRQGRAFGVHVVLGSQTIGGSSGLARSTLGQIAVRVALQCTEADSQMILGDNNGAARLLTRPGEAVYNDAGGLVEANSPFQIAFLPDEQREKYLEHVHELTQTKGLHPPAPIVFEGNSAALIRKNERLMKLLEQKNYPAAASAVQAFVGEPVAIKEPSAIPFRRQSGANVLMVGQQEESAVGIFGAMAASIAAQQKPGEAIFYLMDGTPADSRYYGVLERVMGALPQKSSVVQWRNVPEAINELATMLKERQGRDNAGPSVYLLLFGLQRYRLLRRQEDDFSFSKSEEPETPKPDKQFAELLSEGPAVGLHTVIWADTPITVERTLERASMRQFDHRVLFQMSASDSSNLIDSPLANRLGAHRALLYSEEQGTFEKFRPYEVPDEAWLEFVATQLKQRSV